MEHMFSMDEKDKKIIDILKQDSSMTMRQISKKTKIPITTVHKRIQRLKQDSVIKKFTIEVDHKKTGNPFFVIILMSVDYSLLRKLGKNQHQLADEIKEFPEVERVDIVTGTIDMVIWVRVKNVEDFDNFLLKKFQNINGIDRTQSLVVIHEN